MGEKFYSFVGFILIYNYLIIIIIITIITIIIIAKLSVAKNNYWFQVMESFFFAARFWLYVDCVLKCKFRIP